MILALLLSVATCTVESPDYYKSIADSLCGYGTFEKVSLVEGKSAEEMRVSLHMNKVGAEIYKIRRIDLWQFYGGMCQIAGQKGLKLTFEFLEEGVTVGQCYNVERKTVCEVVDGKKI